MTQASPAGSVAQPFTFRLVLLEGLVAGLIGAAAVAVWFLIVDAIAGRPFFTPAMLGSALFWGRADPQTVDISYATVIGYSMVHVMAFLVVGLVAAALAALVERFPTAAFLTVFLFAVFEVGFYIVVALVAQPLLGALAWVNVASGNLLAAVGMGLYLWRVHPRIRQQLVEHPLGETMDGE
jgi:hypothetical protein